MSRWFRFYDDALNDAKVQRLPAEVFKAWVNLLCLASMHAGALPTLPDIAFALRISDAEAQAMLDQLTAAGLIDDGDPLRPHNWDGRQYRSDSSAERVKRHRNGRCNVTSTVTVTAPDTETDTEDGGGDARARPRSPSMIGDEANRLFAEILEICAIDRQFVPPGWCGAPMRIQTWINQGWTGDVILIAVRKAMGRKRDGAPDSVGYFERAIAREVALQAAPVPTATVVPLTPEIINGKPQHGGASRLLQARDRILEQINGPANDSGSPADDACGEPRHGHARLLPKG